MCLGEPEAATLESARTDRDYVLAFDAATREGKVYWRRSDGAAWLGEVRVVGCPEHRVSLSRDGDGRGVLEAVDRRRRRLRAVVAAKDDAPLLLALTRLLVAIRSTRPSAPPIGKAA